LIGAALARLEPAAPPAPAAKFAVPALAFRGLAGELCVDIRQLATIAAAI
jgi:hypothetical protein